MPTNIEDTARNLFDHENGKHGIPKYDRFIEAFEHYTGLKKGQYTVQPVGHVLIFSTEDKEYEMDCYEGKSHELKTYIDNRSYDEIYIMTNVSIWSDIYLDAGIEKMEFIPRMQSEWEIYWDDLYASIRKRVGSTSHLDDRKEKSWRQFQTYSEGYNDVGDAIRFAWELDDMVFFPLAVITMMNIFDADVCYSEYCELEFDARAEWESIWVNEEDTDCPILHIKPHNC